MVPAKYSGQKNTDQRERIDVRKLTAGLLGTVAVAASLIVLRQPRPAVPQSSRSSGENEAVPAGERVPGQISLDRIREMGY